MSDQLSINWNKYKYTSIYDIDKTTNEWKLWYGNDMADKLAVDGAKKVKNK